MIADPVDVIKDKKLPDNLGWGKDISAHNKTVEYNRKILKAFENKIASPEGTKTKANYTKMLEYLIEGVIPWKEKTRPTAKEFGRMHRKAPFFLIFQ